MTVLVTGGAGFIGSHVVRLLQARGTRVVVLDNLSTGSPSRLRDVQIEVVDLADSSSQREVERIIREHEITDVIHLAAQKAVQESVERPTWYYQQNVSGFANLLAAMEERQVGRMVFSSSAAVYGSPDLSPIVEDTVARPISPYGETKRIGELMADSAAVAWGLKVSKLRYFNVAGTSSPELMDHSINNLIPIVFRRLFDGKPPVVFGDDYPTPDGSCIRDYIHVSDLAEVHLAALDHLMNSSVPTSTFNVGTGTGASVFEVIAAVSRVSGIGLRPVIQPRRDGDPPRVVASVDRVRSVLGWRSRLNLEDIVGSLWRAYESQTPVVGVDR